MFGGNVLWVMLNPSTADAENDDPTIRRVLGFSARFGLGKATVANLFAYRTTNPRELLLAKDPVGPDNDGHIQRMAADADLIILAWGSHQAAEKRAPQVRDMLAGYPLHCLGKTQSGAPRHPLYLPSDAPLVIA